MQQKLAEQNVKYSLGAYNKVKGDQQAIRITEGCPHNCPYCYEPKEYKEFGIPEIVRNNVLIYDMNLLAKHNALNIIEELGERKVNGKVVYYELVCGVDYRFMTSEIAEALKKNRFKKIRIAWDWFYGQQFGIKKAIDMLLKFGYKRNNIMIFMICNWKIPHNECLKKLDLCKIWGVQVADCYFDNQTFPNVQPIHWKSEENKDFRKRVRKHNQLVNFGIDPELKESP